MTAAIVLPLLQSTAVALAPTTDAISQLMVAVVLISIFVLLVRETAHRVLIAMCAVAGLFAITYFTPFHLSPFDRAMQAVDLNVIVLLAAMMALVGVLKTTGAFESMVSRILRRARGRPVVILTLVCWFTALASALLDNVTTVIFVTPMVIGMARRLDLKPHALLLPMVMASNIGGTATLIGDPPNIMIGSAARLSFVDFVGALTLPCALMLFWLEWYARRTFADELHVHTSAGAEVNAVMGLRDPRLGRWMTVISIAVLVGFLTHHLTGMPPAVPAFLGAAAALVTQDILHLRERRATSRERLHGVLQVTEQDIEWPTLAFFGCLFIVVGAAVDTGLISRVADGLRVAIDSGSATLGLGSAGTLALAAVLVCWLSGLASALVDNIPFVAVSIPIVAQLGHELPGDTRVLWWALALGACLGGNGSAIGASANITTIGLAERAGYTISFARFARFGAPVAAATLVISTVYLLLYVWLGAFGAMAGFLAGTIAIGGGWTLARRAAPAAAPETSDPG